jgi:hypothetical protein
MKDLQIMSRLPLNETTNTTPQPNELYKHVEHTLKPDDEEIYSEALRRSKRQRTAKYFGNEFTVYLIDDSPKTILRHSHLLMWMIGNKVFIVRWILFFLMELGSLLTDHMVANL